MVNRYAYDSFGALKSEETIRNAFTYTGREYDNETGLYYYRARYYDPEAGRFVSKDPIGFAGGDVNVFNYVRGNPVNWVDPFGLEPPADIPPGVNVIENIKEAKRMSFYGIMGLIEFYKAVKSDGKWDYKKLGGQYEDFGNYNYGLTGRACKFGPETLKRAAGAYQQKTGTSKPEWGTPYGNPPYGDDPKDQYWIDQGIKDYDTKYYYKK